MKRFLLFFGLLASLTLLWSADFNALKVPAVQVTVSDFTLDYSPASKTVTLTPNAGGAALSGTSDADGLVGFARVTPGLYTLTIAGIGLDPLTLRVPNQSGTLSASNLVISAWTPPSGAPYAGATDNLRAWSLLATDPLALPGALKLSGQTNQIGDNGSALTFNGAAVGGETIWTNASEVVLLFDEQGSENKLAYDIATQVLTARSITTASNLTASGAINIGYGQGGLWMEDGNGDNFGVLDLTNTNQLDIAEGAIRILTTGDLRLAQAWQITQATAAFENTSGNTLDIGALTNRVGNVYATFIDSTNGAAFTGPITSTAGMATNAAAFRVTTSDFVLGTRYTNSNQRATVAASIQLAAAVAGTATVSLYVEHASITNKLTISAGPLASLTTVEALFLPVSPNAVFRFEDEDSGSGAASAIVTGTCSITYE